MPFPYSPHFLTHYLPKSFEYPNASKINYKWHDRYDGHQIRRRMVVGAWELRVERPPTKVAFSRIPSFQISLLSFPWMQFIFNFEEHSRIWVWVMEAFTAEDLSKIGGIATVSLLHSFIPTHWLPFSIVGRAQKWTLSKTLFVSELTKIFPFS